MIKLHDYDLVIINSSGGKDSSCAIWEMHAQAIEQSYPIDRIHVSHQELVGMEWPGVIDVATKQAEMFGMQFHVSRRRRDNGDEETLLDYALRRGKWPSNTQRWCTSDFKRGPGGRVLTALSRQYNAKAVLYVFGYRHEESPARAKKETLTINEQMSNKSRVVHEYNPILSWTLDEVWHIIRSNHIPYHHAYDLGMPRLSCVFCIFAPVDALVIAGKENPDLLDKYIAAEKEMGHSFRNKFAIAEVKEMIESGYEPKSATSWIM